MVKIVKDPGGHSGPIVNGHDVFPSPVAIIPLSLYREKAQFDSAILELDMIAPPAHFRFG